MTAGPGAATGGPARSGAADPDAPDYYQLVGASFTASQEEITAAYRATMKRIHPDRQRGPGRARAEELAKQVNAAYSVLSNPDRRKSYDQTIRTTVVQDQIMSRYVGGFHAAEPPAGGQFGEHFRRDQTEGERRETAESNRGAMITIITVFGAVLLILVAVLLIWAIVASVLGAVH